MKPLEGAATWAAQDEEGPTCSRTGRSRASPPPWSRSRLIGGALDGDEARRCHREVEQESHLRHHPHPQQGVVGVEERQAQAGWNT